MRHRSILTMLCLTAALLLAALEAFAQRPSFGDRGSRGGDRNSRGGTQQPTASSVVAVADERSNSVVVSAPEELLPMVEELIREIDSIIQRTPEVRVFPLRFSDAEEMAELVEDMFDEQSTGGGFRGRTTTRNTNEIQTTAEHDQRTNSVVVSADRDKMPLIAQMIEQLDTDPARDQQVYIYDLKNANPESVSLILQEIIDQNQGRSTGTAGRTTTNRNTTTTQRGTTGSTRNTGNTGRGTTTGR